MRILLVLMLLSGWLPFSMAAQPILTKGGPDLNPKPPMLSWHLDTLSHHAFCYKGDVWQQVDVHNIILDMIACHEGVYLYHQRGYTRYSQTGRHMQSCNWFLCADSIRLERTEDLVVDAYDYHTNLMARLLPSNWFERNVQLSRCVLDGVEGYVLPKWLDPPFVGKCESLRTWGVLGVNGQWLIEPKFDRSFVFRDGIANVEYYGKRCKINEKGEFVE